MVVEPVSASAEEFPYASKALTEYSLAIPNRGLSSNIEVVLSAVVEIRMPSLYME